MKRRHQIFVVQILDILPDLEFKVSNFDVSVRRNAFFAFVWFL
ncbi:hypothetical protein BACCAP_02940 [Pseudoflavonifractor capillosus ATCC 29799]|uniref:Uncharacterized protein n=1 Tax=Pseudoflavonifractor capillosus ATCC 29799 TaxID=411467 RepID=A6NXJ5_9FIRM|nr:hypothetical protein BACCAP_02940 [Pseudoflavonifractor capillosus ATCC 29799]